MKCSRSCDKAIGRLGARAVGQAVASRPVGILTATVKTLWVSRTHQRQTVTCWNRRMSPVRDQPVTSQCPLRTGSASDSRPRRRHRRPI